MLVTLKTLLHTLLLPPAVLLLLAAAGAWLLARHPGTRARRGGIVLLALGLGSLWLLATPVVAVQLWRAAEREPVLQLSSAGSAQAIVILAGGSYRRRAPEYADAPVADTELLERLAYGAYLARRTGLPVLLSGTAPEVEAMRASLEREFGVPTRWLENHSRDTFENAEFSARLLRAAGVTHILLVTDALHEYRAVREFEATGLSVAPAPEGTMESGARPAPSAYLPQAGALQRSSEALYELSGDLVRGVFSAVGLRRHSR